MSKNGTLKLGGQTKKNTETIDRILEACRLGLPLKFCASAGDSALESSIQLWQAKVSEG